LLDFAKDLKLHKPVQTVNSNKLIQMAGESSPPIYVRSQLEATFLPVKQMLQIDRVMTIDGGNIVCEVDVLGHWVFPLHFPFDPIFPGSLLIEAAGQAVAIWAWHAGLRGHPRMVKVEAKFESPVQPQDKIVILKAVVRLRKNVCIGQVGLFVSERIIAEIKPVIIIAPH
jgi:3-hydroxymyristoyl/3-hydroxydecanoyl-(acyl carrier protein) dehydratase